MCERRGVEPQSILMERVVIALSSLTLPLMICHGASVDDVIGLLAVTISTSGNRNPRQ